MKMRNELADGDLLRHLLVEVMAVEHHGLQNGQGPLQDGDVYGGLVHKACYLKIQRAQVTACDEQCREDEKDQIINQELEEANRLPQKADLSIPRFVLYKKSKI